MALSMSRPWKHPDSGYYWSRRRVPEDLRALVGKREERHSLGTRDPVEAKRLHVLKLAEIEERWSNLRQSCRELSADAVAREAALAVASIQRQLDLDPYRTINWDVDVGASLWVHDVAREEIYTDIPKLFRAGRSAGRFAPRWALEAKGRMEGKERKEGRKERKEE